MDIIIKPVITEKSLKEADNGIYTFIVGKTARKHGIRKAVQDAFSVTVLRVATNMVKGSRTRNTRSRRITSDETYKKARVQLAKGEKIQLLEEDSKKKK